MSILNTEPMPSKYELNEEQLEKATGGSSLSLSYERVTFEYSKQKPDGTAGVTWPPNGASLKVPLRDGQNSSQTTL
jgi:hypothetical protein